MTWKPPLETLAPWRAVAERTALTSNTDYYSAFDEEIVRYLRAGDCRPLVDLIYEARRVPGPAVVELVATMFSSDQSAGDLVGCPYRFDLQNRRARGRPSKDAVQDNPARPVLNDFVGQIQTGRSVKYDFWRHFAYAMAADERNRVINPRLERSDKLNSYPVIIGIVRRDGHAGRRKDPESETSQRLLAQSVQRERDTGKDYKSAIPSVAEDIRKQGEAEGWKKGELQFERKVRRAYDELAKALRQNDK